MKIICSNLSDIYTYHDRVFTIPWFELRRGLNGIARIRRRYGIKIQYNDLAKTLIHEIVIDQRNIKEKKSAFEINEQELEKILTDSGFHRQLKDEQKRDVIKLLRLKHGANFSVPGAGKTTTLLALFYY